MPKLPTLTADRLRELALTGADVTLKHLRAEIIAIERAFPELRLPAGRRALRKSFKHFRTRTRTMSGKERKASPRALFIRSDTPSVPWPVRPTPPSDLPSVQLASVA